MNHKKYKMIVIALLLILLYLFIDPISLAKSESVDLHVYVTNQKLSHKQVETILNGYETFSDIDTKNYLIENDIFISLKNPSPAELIDAGRFTAQVAAGELDLLIAEKSIIEHYNALNGFELLETDSNASKKDLNMLMNDKGGIYAFKLSEVNQPSDIYEEIWMAIPKTSLRKNEAHEFIAYLLEGE